MAFVLHEDLLQRLRAARRVTVLTGSGVAAESGVASFREAQTGRWAAFDPTELATPQAFSRNPRLVWEWYAYRRTQIEALQPSDSHYALVDLEQVYPDFMLITQSIDGLHWRAGSRDLLELHGNIGRVRCFECGAYAHGWDEEGLLPPVCALCGGLLRPDVVWMGEGLPGYSLRLAYDAAQQADIFLSVGTSARVQPAAKLPLMAKRAKALVVEINPAETALSVMADYWIPYKAGDVLPELVRQLQGPLQSHEEGL
jgi:NAD-dependent deacetylase